MFDDDHAVADAGLALAGVLCPLKPLSLFPKRRR
jgi:hypothetical protein